MPFLFQEPDAAQPLQTEAPDLNAPVESPQSGQFLFQQAPLPAAEPQIEALKQNPDQAAKMQRLSAASGIPQEDLAADPNTIEAQLRASQIADETKDTPVVNKFLSDPDNAAVAHDDVPNLSAIERISRDWQRGVAQIQLGQLGTKLRQTDNNPAVMEQVQALQKKLADLGQDTQGGFVGYIGPAIQTVGQWAEMVANPGSVTRVGIATMAGAGIGLAGGPAAPVTVPGGAIAGFGAGMYGEMAWQSYVTEGGQSYVELLNKGVDKDTAAVLSNGVGVLNAALEVGGAKMVLAPFEKSVKLMIKESVAKASKDPTVMRLAATFAKDYTAAMLGESSTEVMQELVNIASEEIGKELTDPNLPHITQEQMTQRLTGVFTQTLQAMSVLGVPGATMHTTAQLMDAKKAQANAATLEQLHQQLTTSKLGQRDPEKLAAVTNDIIANSDAPESTYISGPHMMDFILSQPDPAAYASSLGITQAQMDSAMNAGTDIRLDTSTFIKNVLTDPNYAVIGPHVRQDEGGFTQAEADEYVKSGFKEEVREAILAASQPTKAPNEAVDIAEHEMGLKGFFMSADEAGMTPDEYKEYLVSVQKAADRSSTMQQEKELKQQRRELDASWKAEMDAQREIARTSLQDEPAYAALNGVAAERLDQDQLITRLMVNDLTLDHLPMQGKGRKIYQKNGIDVDAYAEMYGFDDGETLALALAHAKPFEDAVEERAHTAMLEKHGDLKDKRQAVSEALRSLHNDDQAKVLETELNALRSASYREKGDIAPKRVSLSLLRKAAKQEMGKFTVREISSGRFLQAEKRLGKAAKKALREGHRDWATSYKFQQLLNFEMFRLAARQENQIGKQKSYMQNFLRDRKSHANMAPEYLKAIREVLANVEFTAKDPRAAGSAAALMKSPTTPVEVDAQYTDANSRQNYRDMDYREFKSLYDQVKAIEHAGKEANRFRRAEEKQTVDEQADTVVKTIDTNVKGKERREERSTWDRFKKGGKSLAATLLNMDTVLRELDGFEDLGPVYQATKGRIDRAMGHGYNKGQVGYLRRQQQVAKSLTNIWDRHFNLKDKKHLDDLVNVPGVSHKISHHTILSVLLNSGNQENIDAMTESNTFSPEEVNAIHNAASAKDIAYANDIFDFLDSFWPEVVEATERRTNTTPEKVVGVPLKLKNGTLQGGYFPIRYDTKESIITGNEVDDLIKQTRFGNFVASHTANGHTQARTKRVPDAKLLMDLLVVNSHVDNVIYDLEVGDAVHDFYKAWYHPNVKKAFADKGIKHLWEYGDVWLRDTISQEIGATNAFEKTLRYIRNGYTISKLAWNFGVMISQPLGLSQASVMVGKKHMLRGIKSFLEQPKFGEGSIFQFQAEKSGFMATRQDNWSRDIHDAQAQFTSKFMDKWTPGNSAEYVRRSFFWGITKTQAITDAIIWQAGYSKGMEMFSNEEKAIEYADRAVIRTQASSIFNERTALERGSLDKDKRQLEMIRAFTPIISYFAAKYNIAYERTKQTNFRNPGQVVSWAWDMSILYIIEGTVGALLANRGPDDDENKGWWLVKQAMNTFAAGIPFVREAAGAVRGFPAGGVVGNVAKTIGDTWNAAATSWKKEEITASLAKGALNLAGVAFHAPTNQFTKAISAADQEAKGKDITAIDYLFGPPPKKKD